MFTDTGKTPNALLENRPPTPKDVEGMLSHICMHTITLFHCPPLFLSSSFTSSIPPFLSPPSLPLLSSSLPPPPPPPSLPPSLIFSHSRGCGEGCMWSSKYGKHLLHECWSTVHQKPPRYRKILPKYETV